MLALLSDTKQAEVDGYDALVFFSDKSDADNKMYRQVIFMADHVSCLGFMQAAPVPASLSREREAGCACELV